MKRVQGECLKISDVRHRIAPVNMEAPLLGLDLTHNGAWSPASIDDIVPLRQIKLWARWWFPNCRMRAPWIQKRLLPYDLEIYRAQFSRPGAICSFYVYTARTLEWTIQ